MSVIVPPVLSFTFILAPITASPVLSFTVPVILAFCAVTLPIPVSYTHLTLPTTPYV